MPDTAREYGPLVLGATGRVGKLWRTLAARGHWPGPVPLWHARKASTAAPGDYIWDMNGPAPADPRLAHVSGMIVLAGATSGDAEALAQNSAAARAALDLALARGIGPVLLASTVAVYGLPASGAPPLTEDAPLNAAAPYGAAKSDMERMAAAHAQSATCLRIANVAGADMLFGNAARGPVTLHRFSDGTSPQRQMIGPLTLARVATSLIDLAIGGTTLPPAINVASPGSFAMSDLLEAAGVGFAWEPAPANALPALPLDLCLLASLVPLAPTDPAALITEARAAGWEPTA